VASIIDQLMARKGCLDPDLIGVSQARAADHDWLRNKGETEHDFLARVVREAAVAGFRVVHICGALQISNIIQLRRPTAAYTDAKE
jgi:hypothetical protein